MTWRWRFAQTKSWVNASEYNGKHVCQLYNAEESEMHCFLCLDLHELQNLIFLSCTQTCNFQKLVKYLLNSSAGRHMDTLREKDHVFGEGIVCCAVETMDWGDVLQTWVCEIYPKWCASTKVCCTPSVSLSVNPSYLSTKLYIDIPVECSGMTCCAKDHTVLPATKHESYLPLLPSFTAHCLVLIFHYPAQHRRLSWLEHTLAQCCEQLVLGGYAPTASVRILYS